MVIFTISRMIYVYICTCVLSINTVLILWCFIYYLIPALIFLCKTRLKMGFSFTVLTWILMYKLETVIFWIIIAFFLQRFFFLKKNKTKAGSLPTICAWDWNQDLVKHDNWAHTLPLVCLASYDKSLKP